MINKLKRDRRGDSVQAFVFRTGVQSTLSYTPVRDMLVHLSADVSITGAGVAVPFNKGDKIILIKGTEYVFSADIVLGTP